jgi:hypothetical protein
VTAELLPEGSPNGEYWVAIYPQAASDQEQASAREPRITYEVTTNDPDETVDIHTDRGWRAPDDPFHLSQWTGDAGSNTIDCAQKGVALPGTVNEAIPLEMPATQPATEQISSMLDESIPEEGSA